MHETVRRAVLWSCLFPCVWFLLLLICGNQHLIGPVLYHCWSHCQPWAIIFLYITSFHSHASSSYKVCQPQSIVLHKSNCVKSHTQEVKYFLPLRGMLKTSYFSTKEVKKKPVFFLNLTLFITLPKNIR